MMCLVILQLVRDSCKLTHNKRVQSYMCATHCDLSLSDSLSSGHLEQLAIACPNLQRLNSQRSNHSLVCLKGLQCIASHCHNLQGLNLLMKNGALFYELLVWYTT